MTVNNGAQQRVTTRGQLRNVQLYYPLYLGGNVPAVYTQSKPDVGVIIPFVGCVRELEFNERAIELSGKWAEDYTSSLTKSVGGTVARPLTSNTAIQYK